MPTLVGFGNPSITLARMDTNTMTDTTGNRAPMLRIPIAPGITLETTGPMKIAGVAVAWVFDDTPGVDTCIGMPQFDPSAPNRDVAQQSIRMLLIRALSMEEDDADTSDVLDLMVDAGEQLQLPPSIKGVML